MKSSVPYFFSLFILLSVFLTACGDDEPEVQTYTLKVTNITTESAEVFFSSNGGNSFDSRGTIPSGEFREFQLSLMVSYTLRAADEGNSADQYYDEQFISNDNPDILSLNVDISK